MVGMEQNEKKGFYSPNMKTKHSGTTTKKILQQLHCSLISRLCSHNLTAVIMALNERTILVPPSMKEKLKRFIRFWVFSCV